MFKFIKTKSYNLENLCEMSCSTGFKWHIQNNNLLISITINKPPLFFEDIDFFFEDIDLFFYLEEMDNINYLPLEYHHNNMVSVFNFHNFQWNEGWPNGDKNYDQQIEFQDKVIKYYIGEYNQIILEDHCEYNNLNDIVSKQLGLETKNIWRNLPLIWDKNLLFIFEHVPHKGLGYMKNDPPQFIDYICGYFINDKFIHLKTTTINKPQRYSVFIIFFNRLIYLAEDSINDLNDKIIIKKSYQNIYTIKSYLLCEDGKIFDFYNSSLQLIKKLKLDDYIEYRFGSEKLYLLNHDNISCYQIIDISNYLNYPIEIKEEIIKLLWINRKIGNIVPKDLLNIIFYYLI